MTFLFWNMGQLDRVELLNEMVNSRGVDVVALAECPADSGEVLECLNQQSAAFRQPRSFSSRLQLFSRMPATQFREVYGDETGRMTVRSARFRFGELLFVVAHLPSKVNWDSFDQGTEAGILGERLRRLENERGHRRTILVGDLNMHPFEPGVVQAAGFHGMMTRSTVMAETRVVQSREYPFFYNPMWGFLGDQTGGPPGTNYYRHSGHLSYDWNLFDQVLLRPDVLPFFRGEVEILVEVNGTSLLNDQGRPDTRVGSDHLPLEFALEFDME